MTMGFRNDNGINIWSGNRLISMLGSVRRGLQFSYAVYEISGQAALIEASVSTRCHHTGQKMNGIVLAHHDNSGVR
jgi:hypothetical protein